MAVRVASPHCRDDRVGTEKAQRAWTIYLAPAIFLLLRTPYELLHGMVEGEEGTVYLRYAWDSTPLRAILAPHQGYYSFFPNLCGLIAARVLPLEAAGHLCVFAELAIQLLLVHVIVRCEAFRGTRQKAIAAAVGLLTAPTTAIVLCTDNAQFFLAIATGVILVSDPGKRSLERITILLFAGLNGVLSCCLLPFFAFQAWRQRDRSRWIQTGTLAACTVIQAIAVFSQHRVSPHSSAALLAGSILAEGPLSQFATRWSAAEFCKVSGSPRILPFAAPFWLGVGATALAYLVAILAFGSRDGRPARLLSVAAIFSLVLSLSHAGAVNYDLMCGSGAHYFFTFNLLLGFALVCLSFSGPHYLARAAQVLIACSILSGAADVLYLLRMPHAPDWHREVQLWRADPEHRIRIGPGGWPGIRLTPEHANLSLPARIYDSTQPGWQDR